MNAFRFFHVHLPWKFHFVDDNGKILKKVRMSDTYLKADMLKTEYNDVLRGMLHQKQRMNQPGYTNEVRLNYYLF